MATQDQNGVSILYSNAGNIRYWGPLQERGGTRADISDPPLNAEYTGYFRGGGSDDNAGKFRGGRHSDSVRCDGCCYIPACPSNGGSPRFRTECPHPDYGGGTAQTHGSCPSFSNFNGMKMIVWNTRNNCVHWEMWVDPGNGDSAPANQWTRVMSSDDCNGYGQMSNCGGGPLLRPRGSSSSFTWRCDGGPDSKWMSVVELVPGSGAPPPGTGNPPPGNPPPGTPGTGGGGGVPGGGMPPGGGSPGTGEPGPIGGGGGGAGNDNNTGTGGGGGGSSAHAFAGQGCAIAQAGNTVAQAGTCKPGGTGVDDFGDTPGSGGVGGATEPKPVITVYKDFTFLYNIRVDLQDNCTISGDPNITNYEEIYSVSPVAGEYIPIFKNGLAAYYGTKLHGDKSALKGKKIRKVSVTMKKSTNVALTGTLKIEIRDRNGNLMYEFDQIIDPATLTLNDLSYDFIDNNNPYKLEVGDMVLLSYADGGDTTNHVLVAHAPQEAFDGFNTIFVESQSGINFDTDQLADMAAKLYI